MRYTFVCGGKAIKFMFQLKPGAHWAIFLIVLLRLLYECEPSAVSRATL